MIPLRVQPVFFLSAALIGYLNSQSLIGVAIWVVIIFISVLFHEYGHALTALWMGRHPSIELVAFGGVTLHDGDKLSLKRQFLIVFNGPLLSFLLFLICSYVLSFPSFSQGLGRSVVQLTAEVNFFWTILNLLPIIPLDGGQLLRIILEGISPSHGARYGLMTSLIVSVLVSLVFFLYGAFLGGAFFFFLSFQSFTALRQMQKVTLSDQDETSQRMFVMAEQALAGGNQDQALSLLETLKEKLHSGVLYEMTLQYLAILYEEKGKIHEAYLLLLPLQEKLGGDGVCLLQRLSFLEGDYSLVKKLSGPCFQHWPIADVALRNAYAHGELGESIPALEWLETAVTQGLVHIAEILESSHFNPIRHTRVFLQFQHGIKK